MDTSRSRAADALFTLAVVLCGVAFVQPGRPTWLIVLGVAIVAAMVVVWVWRARRHAASPALAVIFAVLAVAAFLVANDPLSIGVQWIAAMLLMLDLGLTASLVHAAVLVVTTFATHTASGDPGRGLLEAVTVALVTGLGIEVAGIIRGGERSDAERRDALRRLESANAQLQIRLGAEQDLVLAEERQRVATALHDGLGHRLTAIGLSLDFSERMRRADPERAAAEVRTARATASDALDEMRRVVRVMHPVRAARAAGVAQGAGAGRGAGVAQEEGIVADVSASLEALADSFGSTGLEVAVVRDEMPLPLSREAGLLVLRFAQEGLTNVVRHARADRAELRLEGAGDAVRIALRDDGGGAPGISVAPGFGIRSLTERAEAMGGSLSARNLDGGFALTMTLPAEEP